MTKEDLCIHCACCGHHLEAMYDQDYDQVYLCVEVKPRGLWSAIKEAWSILWRVRGGCYEEIILGTEEQEKLLSYLRQISNRRIILKKGG